MPSLVFEEESHSYFLEREDGGFLRVPSVSHVIRSVGFDTDFTGVDPFVLVQAQNRGTDVHALIASEIRGDLKISDVPDHLNGYMDSYFALLVQLQEEGRSFVSPRIEERLTDEMFSCHYAGTVDLVAEALPLGFGSKGDTVVVDWKTSSRITPANILQVDAYMHLTGASFGLIGHLRKDGSPAKLVDVTQSWSLWPSIMDLFRFRKERGLEKEYE